MNDSQNSSTNQRAIEPSSSNNEGSSGIHQAHSPESINLTSNDSSVNLLSGASQTVETSSLQTNYSSDCIVGYDSDHFLPLTHDSGSGSKINVTQGSANRLDEDLAEESVATFQDMPPIDRLSEGCNSMNEHQFTIGSPSTHIQDRMNIMFMNDGQHVNEQEATLFDPDDINIEDVDNETYDPYKQVIVGICAMEKKAQSKPMKEILRRLEDYFEFIKTLVFEESVILNKSIEEWPLCDCLISFHSKGFPLSKAIEYARLRRPFLVNDLDIQYDIQDRRKVYKILEEADIELPRYAVLDRDSANPEDRELVESDDHIEVANFVFNKPFVEKPISAEDHNICIYYPAHAGGGSQRLFRKIGCRSSVYSNESHVRKTGSYIYEEFMPTDGTDVKVYTAGPDYAHAEARKSPALDGKVERDVDGKEIRYPVILTNREKMIARKVCLAFKQTVCGFDLLRANGRSYVCDVNGFSFVKSSMKYYEDCSKILGNMMLRALAPQLHIPWSIPFQLDDPPIVPTTFGRMMELRCVIAVIRHGDRTPKQKMKLEVKHPRFFELYHKYGNLKNGQAKLKKPKQLQEVLDIARYLLSELATLPEAGEVVEPRVKLKQLKSVLEMYGHFSGINRKVQLKYQPHGRPRRSSSEDEIAREPSLVLILKWGGELTPAGRVQAEDLGRCFRRLYPASGDYSGPQGLGLLRLHSTFRHDLKIYASDEGRVQMTAAAFAKGFLALEGELTPILFQMVKSANTNGLLDNDCESSKCQKIVKERLHDIMQKNFVLTAEDMEVLNPTDAPSIEAACKFIGNPYQACEKVHKLIKELNSLIKSKRQENGYTQEYHLYHGETWDLLQRRWAKLEKDFKFPRSRRFDISKIPDIYDCIKYDLQHNQHTLQFQFAHELHTYAKALADIVIPQEYGITSQEKLMISLGTCSPLLRKIQADLLRNADSSNDDETESVNRLDPKYSHGVSSPDRHVRTRLYFTSESHIHSLITALQFGGLLDVKRDEQWHRSMEFLSAISELNYLSQIVIMLYEDPTKEPSSDDRFHVEIHFSSGVINRITQSQNMPTEPQGPGFRPHLHNKSYSNASSTNDPKDSDNSSQFDTSPATANTIRSKLASMSVAAKQHGTVIKEELTDDERSTDGESRGHSKSSSACITPKKTSTFKQENTGDVSLMADNHEQPRKSPSGDEFDIDNNHTLTQDNVALKLAIKSSHHRRLSRSYSAVAPVSLQELFIKKEPDKDFDAQIGVKQSGDNRSKLDGDTGALYAGGQEQESITDSVTTINKLHHDQQQDDYVPATTTDGAMKKLSSPVRSISLTESPRSPLVRDKSDNRGTPLDRQLLSNSSVGKPRTIATSSSSSTDKTASEGTSSSNAMMIENADGQPAQSKRDNISAKASAKLTAKQNWKTYEQQHLIAELNTPHLRHYHYHLRRYRNQPDQQLISNLPPTYHTIHHLNFSPTVVLSSMPNTSASMSTSPQHLVQGGNLHQRYLAHKQQQQAAANSNKFFTMSASMPIQYKSSQNPRACSMADVSQYCGGPSSLISTAVISGSSPELVAVCPYSPTIRPLETLHNELSLKQFNEFIFRLTRNMHRNAIPESHHHHHHHHHHHNLISQKTNESSEILMEHKGVDIGDNSHQLLLQEPLDLSISGNVQNQHRIDQTGSNLLASNNCPNNLALSSRGSSQPRIASAGQQQQQQPALSPGNSLSNSLIWSGPPSSFASSPGPSSPSAALDLWSKLEETASVAAAMAAAAAAATGTLDQQPNASNTDRCNQSSIASSSATPL